MGTEVPSYRGFRYPIEIISHCVWLYYSFPLSFREVQEMMLQRFHRRDYADQTPGDSKRGQPLNCYFAHGDLKQLYRCDYNGG